MTNIKYKITFFSEWHAGSGLTSGSDLDALVIKDQQHLPFIPGKTLKGLLKEAAEILKEIEGPPDDAFIKEVFGMESSKPDESPEASTQGSAHFTNAELSTAIKSKILHDELAGYLYRDVASTEIGASGVAKKHSLRRMETTIPVILEARILNIDEKYTSKMKDCFKWIKRLGQNRHRGLGRCSFEFIEEGGLK